MTRARSSLLITLITALLLLALPAAAQAHCTSVPRGGYVTAASHDGSNYASAYTYQGSAAAYFPVNSQLYSWPYSSTWAYVYGTSWVYSGGWRGHTGWHWIQTTNFKC